MANEITLTLDFQLVKDELTKTISDRRRRFDQAGVGAFDAVLDIGTSEETITLTDITTEGWAYFKNLDDTNFVTWGPDSTGLVPMGRMNPGESAGPLRIEPGIAISMQADTAACRVRVMVLED